MTNAHALPPATNMACRAEDPVGPHDVRETASGPRKDRPASGARLAGFLLAALPVAGFVTAVLGHAAQHPPTSLFTSIALDTCKVVSEQGDAEQKGAARATGRSWQCPALMPVFASEREDHFYVAIGPNGAKHKAARQTLTAANSPLDHKSKRITVEWRVKTRAAGPQPYASIIRYFTGPPGKAGEVLVVTKIANAQSCHVAYIDAKANPDAIVMARSVADEKAHAFNCATDEPAWIGAVGAGARKD